MDEVIKKLGKPSENFLNIINNKNTREYLRKGSEKKDATEGVQYHDGLVLDLINKCLVMEPEKRISAGDALKHVYFQNEHDDQDEPVFKGELYQNFEYDKN